MASNVLTLGSGKAGKEEKKGAQEKVESFMMRNRVPLLALIGLLGSGLGSLLGVIASSKLTQYRIQKLEEQVAKHNNMVERTYKLEGRMDEAEHDIRDLKGRGA